MRSIETLTPVGAADLFKAVAVQFLTMRTVREALGQTQIDVARTTGMDHSDVSRLENRDDFGDCQVSTLQRYVAALGGHLEFVAAFGEKKIVLTGTRRPS